MTMAASDVDSDSTMVAIYPPKGWVDLLGPHTHSSQTGKLHVTLVYLGNKTEAEAQKALELVQSTVAGHPSVSMKCNGAAVFDNPDAVVRVLQPSGVGLNELRAKIYTALDEAGLLDKQNHGFVPHMTLEYHTDRKLPANWERVAQLPFGQWTVNEVRVVRGDKEVGRARLGLTEKGAQMTPFEQGYFSFLKIAGDGEWDTGDTMIAGGGGVGVGGLGAKYVGDRAPRATAAAERGMQDLMNIQMPDYHGMSPTQARNFVDQYTQHGFELMSNPALTFPDGDTWTGRHFMERIRSNPIVEAGLTRMKMPGWSPEVIEHYDAFATSPAKAVEQLIRESDHPNAIPVRQTAEMADDVAKRVGQETIKKLTNYRKLVPGIQTALQIGENARSLGRPVALLGGGVAGLGLVHKLTQD